MRSIMLGSYFGDHKNCTPLSLWLFKKKKKHGFSIFDVSKVPFGSSFFKRNMDCK